jgi:MFS family permease
MSPTAVLTTVVAIATGRLVLPRLGMRVTIAVGALVIVVGLGLYALAIPQQPHVLAFFLPAAAVGAIGIGAVTTGVSTAAALSVAPQRFAAATGLNQTARQIGGALGVAILAAILAGYSGSRLDAYRLVFGVFTAFAAATAIVGLFIGNPVRPATPSPGPVAVPVGTTTAMPGPDS